MMPAVFSSHVVRWLGGEAFQQGKVAGAGRARAAET